MSALEKWSFDRDSLIAAAEAMLAASFYNSGVIEKLIGFAHSFAAMAREVDPDHWHSNAIFAATSLAKRKRSLATSVFEKALEANKEATERYTWYHLYLLASGRLDEGVLLAQRHAEGDPFAVNANAFFIAVSYLAHDIPRSAAALIKLYEEHREGSWIVYLTSALLVFNGANNKMALGELIKSKKAIDDHDYRFPGLALLLSAAAEPSLDVPTTRRLLRELIELMDLPHPIGSVWLQSALAALSFPLHLSADTAVECLRRAELCQDPLMLFALSLPLLDPLRGTECYKSFEADWAAQAIDPTSLIPIETLRAKLLALGEPETADL